MKQRKKVELLYTLQYLLASSVIQTYIVEATTRLTGIYL